MGAISDFTRDNATKTKTPGSAHLNLTMGGLVGLGGIMGYIKAKSVPSLVAGVGVGALFAGSGYLIKEGQNTNGHGLASITSLALIGGMAPRAMKGGMAAGVVALGVGSLVYNAKKTMDWMGSE